MYIHMSCTKIKTDYRKKTWILLNFDGHFCDGRKRFNQKQFISHMLSKKKIYKLDLFPKQKSTSL